MQKTPPSPHHNNPRLPEDPRLLYCHQETGFPSQTAILTCEGEFIALEQLKQALAKQHNLNVDNLELCNVPSNELHAPRSLVIPNSRLPNLPPISDIFFDADYLTAGEDDVKLFNVDEDVYTGLPLNNSSSNRDSDTRRTSHLDSIMYQYALNEIEQLETTPNPKAIFPGGPTGAGKSAILQEATSRFSNNSYLLLERDAMRKKVSFLYNIATHPKVGEHQTDYRYIHNLLSRYHEIAIDIACKYKINLIKDGSLSDPNYLNLFEKLHDAGYQTEAFFILIPVEMGIKRNQIRYQTEGRQVTKERAEEMATQIVKTLFRLIASKKVDRLYVESNVGKKGDYRPLLAETKRMTEIQQSELRKSGVDVFTIQEERDPIEDRVFCVYDMRIFAVAINNLCGHCITDNSRNNSLTETTLRQALSHAFSPR